MTEEFVLPKSQRPTVIANFAMTMDGKVSTRNRTPSLFTSPRDKSRLLEIRSTGDALLVGRATVEADTMSMGLPDDSLRAERLARGQAEFPIRVVISAGGNFNPDWKIFHSPGGRVILFASKSMGHRIQNSLLLPGKVDMVLLEDFSIAAVLQSLKNEFGVRSAVCEGGPTLLRSLLAIDALDEMYLTIAPRIFGGEDAPTLTGVGGLFFAVPRRFQLTDFVFESGEVFTHYTRQE
jgi:riboflavin-specific deaminase-like protein